MFKFLQVSNPTIAALAIFQFPRVNRPGLHFSLKKYLKQGQNRTDCTWFTLPLFLTVQSLLPFESKLERKNGLDNSHNKKTASLKNILHKKRNSNQAKRVFPIKMPEKNWLLCCRRFLRLVVDYKHSQFHSIQIAVALFGAFININS